MIDKRNIYSESKAAFNERNYALSFQILWKAGIHSFVSFTQKVEKKSNKTNWFIHPEASKFFWKEFIFSDDIFESLFKSNSADQILHNYFTKLKYPVIEFEKKLANSFPDQFVKAVRVNQVYLDKKRIGQLKTIQLNDQFQIHQKIWQWIQKTEQRLWKEIENDLQSISDYSLIDLLSHCIIWLETNRFRENSKFKLHQLASVFSFFIELILSKYPNKQFDNVDDIRFFKRFLEIFKSTTNQIELIGKSPVSSLLSMINHWILFKEHVITPYCFDLSIEPIQQNELVFFQSTPKTYYNWLVNGVRYEITQLQYTLKGHQTVEYLEQNSLLKIPGKTKTDVEMNRELAVSKWSTLLLLEDLACQSFRIGKTSINTEQILDPILTFSSNRSTRYEDNLSKHALQSRNWNEAFMKLLLESINLDIQIDPYILMSEEEYFNLNKNVLPELSKNYTKEIIQLFSFSPNPKFGFNRFQSKYDVWQKPFLKIGDVLFCPTMFFATNLWFYSFTQVALRQRTSRNETQKMENHLGELIRQKGWKVKVTNDKEAGFMDGDVDIFVEGENTTLFIQLKRTYFRLNSKDSHFESMNSDLKASSQLNLAEKYLEKSNPVYQLKHKPVKWILSTSFESIGHEINGCFKVNYFDFLNALNDPKTENLSQFIQELKADKNLKEFVSSAQNPDFPFLAKQIILETIKPLSIFGSKDYKEVILSDDPKTTQQYNYIFDEALRLDREGKKRDALTLVNKCISQNPGDGDALGVAANILADMKLFDLSFTSFQKALELLPNDPYISRNYSLALLEGGRSYEGLQLALQLNEQFPLLGGIRILFEKAFDHCLRHGLLASEQIIELKTKWDSMN